MAVKSVIAKWQEASYDRDEKAIVTVVVEYMIITDDDKTGKSTGWNAINQALPETGSFFGLSPYDALFYDQGDFRNDLRLWHVHAQPYSETFHIRRYLLTYKNTPYLPNYLAPNKDKGKNNNPKDPTDEPPEIEIDYEPYAKYPAKDIVGKLWANSAGDPFQPTPVTLTQKKITWKINLSPDDWQDAQGLKDGVNASPTLIGNEVVGGAPQVIQGSNNDQPQFIGSGKVQGIKGVRKVKNGKVYYEATFTIIDRGDDPDGWTTPMLDCGSNVKQAGAPGGKGPLLVNGVPVKIVALDGNGNAAAVPAIIRFMFYKVQEWNGNQVFQQVFNPGA